ncbi:MAG TPA: FAD/NAD(P)-binding oxidoreductase [Gaiellaceae bacterium]|jgi:NADPH-dependent 2,4-dienoyl-CoA reductase/sulfur reductase-like enzyme|nr:FAD/NAD(P)-binding oxidoreductase [Gaiellaceae bacterium]
MDPTRYLIVGGGLTADAACKGIREHDPDGRILVVGDEPHPPYLRPPLSKALWKGDDESTIWRGTAELGVELRLGRRIVGLDLERREARDDKDETYGYDKLLLATGGRPRRLPFGGDAVIYFRTLDDYRHLRALAKEGARCCMIGGGFIGSEIAAALALNGFPVTMVFPDPGICARVFPEELSTALSDYYRSHGVEVLTGVSVTAIERHGTGTQVMLGYGRPLEADVVVAGIGIVPNAELAADVGLPVANGIVVDAYGRVGGREDVFAAGDVARFPVAALATDMRVEHEDHAKSHGRQVGANMAGAAVPYEHLPFFYSDLFDLGYEAVGELDPRLETISDWTELAGEATFTYVDRERRPRGVLSWNRFGRLDAARELILAAEPIAEGASV